MRNYWVRLVGGRLGVIHINGLRGVLRRLQRRPAFASIQFNSTQPPIWYDLRLLFSTSILFVPYPLADPEKCISLSLSPVIRIMHELKKERKGGENHAIAHNLSFSNTHTRSDGKEKRRTASWIHQRQSIPCFTIFRKSTNMYLFSGADRSAEVMARVIWQQCFLDIWTYAKESISLGVSTFSKGWLIYVSLLRENFLLPNCTNGDCSMDGAYIGASISGAKEQLTLFRKGLVSENWCGSATPSIHGHLRRTFTCRRRVNLNRCCGKFIYATR